MSFREAQRAYEFSTEASYQSGLDASERFDRMVDDLRKIPAFVREALDQPRHAGSRDTYFDRLIEAVTEGSDVDQVIEDACVEFASAQQKTLTHALMTEREIVADWERHQDGIDRLVGVLS